MTIGGGGVNHDKLEDWYTNMFEDYDDKRQEKLDKIEERRQHRLSEEEEYTLKIMDDYHGRKWMWNFVINAPIVRQNPYTGNAGTHHILGEQRQAKCTITYLKNLALDLFQLMEKEAYERKKKEERGKE